MLTQIIKQAEEMLSDSNDFHINITFKITQSFPDKRACYVQIQLNGYSEEPSTAAEEPEKK